MGKTMGKSIEKQGEHGDIMGIQWENDLISGARETSGLMSSWGNMLSFYIGL